MNYKKILIILSEVVILIILILAINYKLFNNVVQVYSNNQVNMKKPEDIEQFKKDNKIINEEIQEKTFTEEISTKIVEEPSKKEKNDVKPKEITVEKEIVSKPKEEPTKKVETVIEEKQVIEEPAITETPKTLKEQNDELIKFIKNSYGYEVSYGNEDFWFGGIPSTLLTDEEKANKALIDLKKKSALFPNNFFKTFQGYNGFRVILFEHIQDAAGVTSYEFGDDNVVAIDVNAGFLGRVFYHELFHIMEQYIKYKTYNSVFPFDDWSGLNPEGFTYADTNDYKYTVYDINEYLKFDNPSEIAFVSLYAKSKPNEDRAELFADLMFRGIKKEYMYKGFGVNEKAKKLSLILRQYFNSTGAYWERNIDWS